MIGPVLILIGLFLLWATWKGKAGAMWGAITGDSGFSTNLDSLANSIGPLGTSNTGSSNPSSSKSSAPVSGNTPDSGTHMGIGPDGSIITINSTYGAMTPEEKDAANAYARQIGNISG